MKKTLQILRFFWKKSALVVACLFGKVLILPLFHVFKKILTWISLALRKIVVSRKGFARSLDIVGNKQFNLESRMSKILSISFQDFVCGKFVYAFESKLSVGVLKF